MKRKLGIVLAFVGVIILLAPTVRKEIRGISDEKLLALSEEKLLEELISLGLELPPYYNDHKDTAAWLVYIYTPKIMSREVDPEIKRHGFEPANELVSNLGKVLREWNFGVDLRAGIIEKMDAKNQK